MDLFVDFDCALQNDILKINENCCLYRDLHSETGSLWERSKHKLNPIQTGQPRPTAAKQIVPQIFLDPPPHKMRMGHPRTGDFYAFSWWRHQMETFSA